MSSFPILDLVIGMIFIYFLLSIICSSAAELWFSMLRTRARLLEEWLKKIFDQPSLDSQGKPLLDSKGKPVSLGQAIMDHCMTTALTSTGKAPTYINAKDFVSALLDKITIVQVSGTGAQTQAPPVNLAGYITAIANSTVISGELKRTMLAYANEAQQAAALNTITAAGNTVKSELEHFRERIEGWYNSNSERLAGAMKRTKVLPTTLVIAIAITISLNADTIKMGGYLYDHKEKAKEFSDNALNSLESYKERIEDMKVKDTARVTNTATIAQLDSNLSRVKQDIAKIKEVIPDNFPLGWKKKSDQKNNNETKEEEVNWLSRIAGWLASILAICLGAPFWFDVLNKIANLRGAGPKPSTDTSDKK